MPEANALRIFISSPSDVRPERLIAEKVVERLAREFAAHFPVEPILWEREPLVATAHFQTMITPPSETDIAVVVLWSTLGTNLPKKDFSGAISGSEVTGTEWEFEDAVAASRQVGRPDLLLYRKTAPVMASLDDDAALEARRAQKMRVEQFFRRWFVDSDTGNFKAASHTFADPAEFEDMLEIHLRAALRRRVEESYGDGSGSVRWIAGSPYRGLASFDIEHAPVFFGRTRARNELRQALIRQAAWGHGIVMVLGASGCGKSSLVKAGLLADIALPGMVANIGLCRYAILQPSDAGGDPIAALAGALFQSTALPELAALGYTPQSISEILSVLPHQVPIPQALAAAGEAAGLIGGAEARLCLVIDQFEEVFTHPALTETKCKAFTQALTVLAGSGLVWVVATMRSDFFEHLATLPEFAACITGDGLYLLTFPNTSELDQLIRRPAQLAGLRFEMRDHDGVALDDIIREAATRDREALPLIEFVLDQLWLRRTPANQLTFAAYEGLGGLEGAIARRAEECFNSLPAEQQTMLPALFFSLITLEGESSDRPLSMRTAMTNLAATPSLRSLIGRLVDERLLISSSDQLGSTYVRFAHEALLSHWPRARNWVEENRRLLRAAARLSESVARWEAEGRHSDFLLTAERPIEDARSVLSQFGDHVGASAHAFIAACLERVHTRKTRESQRFQEMVVLFASLGHALLLVFFSSAELTGGFSAIGLDFIVEQRIAIRSGLAMTIAPWVVFLPGFLGYVRNWPSRGSWQLLMALGGLGWIVSVAGFVAVVAISVDTGHSTYRLLQGWLIDLIAWVRTTMSLEAGVVESAVMWGFVVLACAFIVSFVVLTKRNIHQSTRQESDNGGGMR